MELLILIIIFGIWIWVSSDAISNGLELGKKSSWMYGLIGFICGFALVRTAPSYLDDLIILKYDLLIGGLFALITMFSGVVMRYHEMRFDPRSVKIKDNRFKALYLRYKREENPNFFTRLAEKILEKLIEPIF